MHSFYFPTVKWIFFLPSSWKQNSKSFFLHLFLSIFSIIHAREYFSQRRRWFVVLIYYYVFFFFLYSSLVISSSAELWVPYQHSAVLGSSSTLMMRYWRLYCETNVFFFLFFFFNFFSLLVCDHSSNISFFWRVKNEEYL